MAIPLVSAGIRAAGSFIGRGSKYAKNIVGKSSGSVSSTSSNVGITTSANSVGKMIDKYVQNAKGLDKTTKSVDRSTFRFNKSTKDIEKRFNKIEKSSNKIAKNLKLISSAGGLYIASTLFAAGSSIFNNIVNSISKYGSLNASFISGATETTMNQRQRSNNALNLVTGMDFTQIADSFRNMLVVAKDFPTSKEFAALQSAGLSPVQLLKLDSFQSLMKVLERRESAGRNPILEEILTNALGLNTSQLNELNRRRKSGELQRAYEETYYELDSQKLVDANRSITRVTQRIELTFAKFAEQLSPLAEKIAQILETFLNSIIKFLDRLNVDSLIQYIRSDDFSMFNLGKDLIFGTLNEKLMLPEYKRQLHAGKNVVTVDTRSIKEKYFDGYFDDWSLNKWKVYGKEELKLKTIKENTDKEIRIYKEMFNKVLKGEMPLDTYQKLMFDNYDRLKNDLNKKRNSFGGWNTAADPDKFITEIVKYIGPSNQLGEEIKAYFKHSKINIQLNQSNANMGNTTIQSN